MAALDSRIRTVAMKGTGQGTAGIGRRRAGGERLLGGRASGSAESSLTRGAAPRRHRLLPGSRFMGRAPHPPAAGV